ncbi:MAG: GNAT family N-acetyltransferase [Clostridia bacterium]|nr:GNAT family N-acetyltransferase [Clostridia bacterium]
MTKKVEQIRRKMFGDNGIYSENRMYILRTVLPTDKESYLSIYQKRDGMRWMFDDPEFHYAEELWKTFNDLQTLTTVIVRKSDEKFCGYCGLKGFEDGNAPELFIELVAECQHQGIGSEVIPMLLSKFSHENGTHEFISKVSSENIASQKLMRKLGGKAAGIARFPDVTEMAARILEESDSPQPEYIEALAKEFETTPRALRSHALVFRFTV